MSAVGKVVNQVTWNHFFLSLGHVRPVMVPRAYPIPNSSMRSSTVPQTRQINARQSPHTSGSGTARAHIGQ